MYPDSGKVMIRSLGHVGFLHQVPYLEAEPEPGKIFALAEALALSRG